MKSRLPRRLLLTAAIGLVALGSMAGCRVEQGAAAFVGETRITDSQVNEVVDSIPVDLITNDLSKISDAYGGVRNQVVEALAVVELGRQVADDTGGQPDPAAAAAARNSWTEGTGLSQDNAFVSLMADAEGYRELLRTGATPEPPTESDVEAAADNFTATTGQALDDLGLAQLASDLDSEQGRQLVGQQRQVAQYVTEYDVTANPKYGQLAIVTFLNPSGVPLLTAPVPS